MGRLTLLVAGVVAVPLLFAALALPVRGAAPSVEVLSPSPESVVEGMVLVQGTAEDSDGDLRWIEIAIEGRAALLKVRIPGNRDNTTWEIPWNSQGEADGVRAVSVWARDKVGQTSAPVNFTLVVDNLKEPTVQSVDLLFDALENGTYTPWQDLDAVPTTRLALELGLSEEMEVGSLNEAVAFDGGPARWTTSPGDGGVFFVNVSYLQANTSYDLTIASSATDMAGNSLATPFVFSFHTSIEPTPGTPEEGGGLTLPFSPVWLWIGGGATAAAVGIAVAWRTGALRRIRARLR